MKHILWPELDELGDAKVRERLLLGHYRGSTRFYVEEWLRRRELPLVKEALRRRDRRAAQLVGASSMAAVVVMTALAAVGHLFLID